MKKDSISKITRKSIFHLSICVSFGFLFSCKEDSNQKKLEIEARLIKADYQTLGFTNEELIGSEIVIFDGRKALQIVLENPEEFDFNLFDKKIIGFHPKQGNIILLIGGKKTFFDGKWHTRNSLEFYRVVDFAQLARVVPNNS